eukprot:6185411-Pleurochrysis_carterae.AAC.10
MKRPTPCSARDWCGSTRAMCHRQQIWLAGLREQCRPEIDAPILLQSGHPDMIIPHKICRVHLLSKNEEVRVVKSHLHGPHRPN